MAKTNSQNRKKDRKTGYLEEVPNKYLIFCEGKQTEPLYFGGLKTCIESNPIYKNTVHVQVWGTGTETLRVIYAAENFVSEKKIKNANIWCVYDKDSFPAADFNSVAQYAAHLNTQRSDVQYYVAWSNECIEYWFILHFEFYESNTTRKDYRKFLHKKFAELGWVRYEKNNSELFDILTKFGNPKRAIKWAQQRLDACAGKSDSNSVPATKVHLLIQELANYLPDDVRSKYI